MALGATPGAIARLVLGHAARWTFAGAALGVIASLFAARLLEAMLFHVSARDPWILAAAVAALWSIAMIAAWVPSRRAARIDPMQALRHNLGGMRCPQEGDTGRWERAPRQIAGMLSCYN